ncbi:MAG: hypothetical protein K2G91_03760, partial [Prevotella sp.]|nr:hypothetical protein [Prevotella sp.]
NYVATDGSVKSFDCNKDSNKDGFISDPEKVDTVVLAEAFPFPTTNFSQNTSKVSLTLKCSITARQNANYSREMLLDCIYLRPRTSKPE